MLSISLFICLHFFINIFSLSLNRSLSRASTSTLLSSSPASVISLPPPVGRSPSRPRSPEPASSKPTSPSPDSGDPSASSSLEFSSLVPGSGLLPPDVCAPCRPKSSEPVLPSSAPFSSVVLSRVTPVTPLWRVNSPTSQETSFLLWRHQWGDFRWARCEVRPISNEK
jgi:hypothetical protein